VERVGQKNIEILLLLKTKPRRFSEICKLVGISDVGLLKLIRKWSKEGWIKKLPNGYYTLTKKGLNESKKYFLIGLLTKEEVFSQKNVLKTKVIFYLALLFYTVGALIGMVNALAILSKNKRFKKKLEGISEIYGISHKLFIKTLEFYNYIKENYPELSEYLDFYQQQFLEKDLMDQASLKLFLNKIQINLEIIDKEEFTIYPEFIKNINDIIVSAQHLLNKLELFFEKVF